MAQWLYLVHPPRERFIETITPDEAAIMSERHSPYLAELFEAGTLILAGPTWGQPLNDGVAIIDTVKANFADDFFQYIFNGN